MSQQRKNILTTIKRLGRSRWILLPEPILNLLGLEDRAELVVRGNTIVVRRPNDTLRSDWAEASKRIAARGDDALVMPEFANHADLSLGRARKRKMAKANGRSTSRRG